MRPSGTTPTNKAQNMQTIIASILSLTLLTGTALADRPSKPVVTSSEVTKAPKLSPQEKAHKRTLKAQENAAKAAKRARIAAKKAEIAAVIEKMETEEGQ